MQRVLFPDELLGFIQLIGVYIRYFHQFHAKLRETCPSTICFILNLSCIAAAVHNSAPLTFNNSGSH